MRISLSRFAVLLSFVLCLCSCQQYRVCCICARFGVNLRGIPFKVVEKTEHWCPNGDGDLFVRVSFPSAQEDELNHISSQMRISGALEMPMLTQHKKLMSGKGANYVKCLDTGLYLIDIDESDSRNYSLIIYNEARKELVLQTMVY